MKKLKFYTRFDRPEKDFGQEAGGESLTRQSEAEACDINKIMERFDRTGQLPISMKPHPQYGDARIIDFQTAKQIVIDAQEAFNELPAKARVHFNHDPQNLLNALVDVTEAKAAELKALGILVDREEDPNDTLKRIAKNTEKVENQAAK